MRSARERRWAQLSPHLAGAANVVEGQTAWPRLTLKEPVAAAEPAAPAAPPPAAASVVRLQRVRRVRRRAAAGPAAPAQPAFHVCACKAQAASTLIAVPETLASGFSGMKAKHWMKSSQFENLDGIEPNLRRKALSTTPPHRKNPSSARTPSYFFFV